MSIERCLFSAHLVGSRFDANGGAGTWVIAVALAEAPTESVGGRLTGCVVAEEF